MTPVEGAFCLGVPNIIVVQSSTTEAPYGRLEPPFAQYTIAMLPLKRVVWSVVGSGGYYSEAEARETIDMAQGTPDFAGIMLDDFFTGQEKGERARLTINELADIRRQLQSSDKKLDIFVTLYTGHLSLPLGDYWDLIDVVTLWTGNPAELVNLEANLGKVERLLPNKRKMLGCYMVDYREKRSMPVLLMQHQCEVGLRWLHKGRIEGIIFLGNTIMDLGFEAVEWTRSWIQKVGGTEI